ncbi:MAG: 2Fe-2S iron-sulfur cluster-binding protein [Parvibaculaceae bacterium]
MTVPRITYKLADGGGRTVDVPNGQSVKDGAIGNAIPGIVAECGGQCACATCHVYVDASWWETVGAPGDIESDMLDFVAAARSETSRLSCQVTISEELDGLIVHVPAEQ